MYIDFSLFSLIYYLIGLVFVKYDNLATGQYKMHWSDFFSCLIWPFVAVMVLYFVFRDGIEFK